jgi:hypothetical protein
LAHFLVSVAGLNFEINSLFFGAQLIRFVLQNLFSTIEIVAERLNMKLSIQTAISGDTQRPSF